MSTRSYHHICLPGMEPKQLRKCDIRRIVQERLAGFRVRQLERDTIRERRRKPRMLGRGVHLDADGALHFSSGWTRPEAIDWLVEWLESERCSGQAALPFQSEKGESE